MHTRREFLAKSATAVSAMALHGVAFSQEKPLVLGNGHHRYQWVPDWLTPPDNMKYGDTHGLAQDAHGRIYLSHTVHPSSECPDGVAVFDEHGKFLTSWGPQFRGGSHGLDLRKEGKEEFLYHCDTNRRVFCKTTLDGKVLWEQGLPKAAGVYDDQHAFVPTNIAFGPHGEFFVSDGYGSSYIHKFDKEANYVKTFAGPGSGKGQTNCPHGIWLDSRGRDAKLAVADRANHRIQYFDLDGSSMGYVTDGMRLPCHFSLRGHEMLVPDLDSVVTILDENNKVIVQLGDGAPSDLRGHPRSDFIPGKFIHPHDAIFLRNGDILVAEWVPIGRVTLLKKLRD